MSTNLYLSNLPKRLNESVSWASTRFVLLAANIS
jgi:hypothetical protein